MASSCTPPACLGELRHSVKFYRKKRVRDSGGGAGPENDPELVFSARAKIIGAGGRERRDWDQLHTPISHKVTLRYNAELIPPDGANLYMVFEGREFNIRDVKDWQERKRWHQLKVEEGVAV